MPAIAPGERHHRDDLAPRPHAGVSRRPRRVADHLRLEAEARAGVEHPDPDRDHRSEDEPERDRDGADRRHRPGRRVDEHLALREDERLRRRVPPVREAVEDEVVEDEGGDVVEHQRGDDLVGAQERPQQARDRAPGGAEHAPPATMATISTVVDWPASSSPIAGGADRAEVQLSLGADVEQPHPERDRGGETGEGERRRGDQRVRERAVREVGGVEQPSQGRDRRMAGREEQERDRDVRHDERAERHGDHQPAPLLEPLLDAEAAEVHASLPADAGRLAAHTGHQQPELLDSRVARVDLADDRALVHHGDAIGQGQHLVEVLADQQHRDLPSPRPRGGSRGRSRSRRRRDRASAPRRRGRAARSRTRARARPSAGCRPRAGGRASAARVP